MSERDYELLSQYLDGELGASQVLELDGRLATEAPLQEELERLRAVNNALRNAFCVPGADHVPTRVTAMLQKPADNSATATTGNVLAFPQQRRASWGFAVAASLLAATGLLFFQDAQQDMDNTLYADPQLAEVLEKAPSSAEDWDILPDSRQVRPILSFHNNTANWCREYLVIESGVHWRGIACRQDKHWTNEVIARVDTTRADPASEYRPAGAADSDKVSDYIDNHAADIALGAKAEAALIARGWK